jgi:hypothetical protein
MNGRRTRPLAQNGEHGWDGRLGPCTDEVRTLDTNRVKDTDCVRHTEPHGIRRALVWLVATPHTPVVNVDQAELISRQGLRDR